MFKKLITLIISCFIVCFIFPTTVRAEDPLLTITTTDPSSPFTFTSSTSNDSTTIDGLTINYDSSNSRFIITIANGKTVNLKQYFSYDNTIDCNTNLLINGNGTLVITKVPNTTPTNDTYYSHAFSINGLLQIGDANTHPEIVIKTEFDYSESGDSMFQDDIYSHQVRIINSIVKLYSNDIVFHIDGPQDDDALFIDNSKVYIEHCCKNDEEAEGGLFYSFI